MANPAPTINQVNAFNATQGTTIDFNIIGGTELVRSNRIYIYNLSDNSLICTHLYVSTESIHELPPNTDSSIVYESGKSSADFVNGAQYYAQIQTFTDIAGTQGGSGLSVAKMFWCLVDPTLTITTIPSTISTTSYNVSATYNANTSVVSNIIQQYQFNLYSATGSLLQSSGVIVGNGEQQGTSTVYDISYNFTGLSVGSSYYTTVDVTTTQGMSVSTQSSTFTVSIDTPTLGEATVVNNACDGYISVTSNLSGEYGGSGSGDIVTFETDSVNDVSSLKVTLTPQQDGTPWIGTEENTEPYLFRAMPTQPHDYNRESGVIVGGTVAWNQMVGESSTSVTVQSGHKYIAKIGGTWSVAASSGSAISVTGGTDMLIDLTALFNHTIADYIYNLEQATAGAGVAWFRQYFPKDYYPYDAGTLKSVQTSAHKTYDADGNVIGNYALDSSLTLRGIPKLDASNNLYYDGDTYESSGDVTRKYYSVTFDGSEDDWNWYAGYYQASINLPFVGKYGVSTVSYICDKLKAVSNDMGSSNIGNYARLISSGAGVGFSAPNCTTLEQFKTWVSNNNITFLYELATPTTETAEPYTSPQAVEQGGTEEYVTSGIVPVGHDSTYSLVCPISGYDEVSAVVSPTTSASDGQTYTTSLGQTVYGGTVDLVSGRLVVDRAMRVFDGSADECWSVGTNASHYRGYTYALSDIKPHSQNAQPTSAICDKIPTGTWTNAFGGVLAIGQTGKAIGFGLDSLGITNYTDLNEWLSNNPITICYELATPQTYQLTPKQINTLVGTNNVWSEQGDIELSYHIPITNLLVKRQDVDDVSGNWLTLYSQPITQASDMDFTFIDFLNQYGKTYKYALVPLLTQTQSGVEVEVEGGYTVSDEVQSIFDGVFIADSTGSQKCKANVGYGNVDMNQTVGTITPIGAKYPVVITNSKNQYHNGSISGTIVPDDYYFNGNLSRIDMVNKRNELEQFLTNKRAKIVKDWNGNIWLVMIMDNVSCTFNNNYGMGIVNFSTNWVEVGDPTNQQDLQATGLINVGGV